MAEQESRREEEVDLLDLLIILLKRKKMVFGITAGIAVLSVIVALLLPPIYRAETKILPPQQGMSGMATQLMSQLGPLAGLAGSNLNLKTPSDLYVGMLESRTVLDRIIDRFDLMKVYDEEYREDTRDELLEVFEAESDKKSGIISVSVEDRDPKRAADMANAFLEELINLSSGLAVTEAAQRRLFFEEQLKETKAALSMEEEGIRGFQERTGALQIDEQAKAAIEGIANLRAQIVSREVQLKVLQSYATSQNPDLQKIKEELGGLKTELKKLEVQGSEGPDPLMPTGRMPKVGTEYFRRLRNLKYYETLYELLAKQFELAKLDEARDSAIIQIIDRALPPDKKAKPRRTLIVVISTLIGLFLACTIALLAEYFERVSMNPRKKERFEAFRRSVRIGWKVGR